MMEKFVGIWIVAFKTACHIYFTSIGISLTLIVRTQYDRGGCNWHVSIEVF